MSPPCSPYDFDVLWFSFSLCRGSVSLLWQHLSTPKTQSLQVSKAATQPRVQQRGKKSPKSHMKETALKPSQKGEIWVFFKQEPICTSSLCVYYAFPATNSLSTPFARFKILSDIRWCFNVAAWRERCEGQFCGGAPTAATGMWASKWSSWPEELLTGSLDCSRLSSRNQMDGMTVLR